MRGSVLAAQCSKINTRLVAIWLTAEKLLTRPKPATAWAEPTKQDYINRFMCGMVYVFKHRGDGLCGLIYGSIYLWEKHSLWRPTVSFIRGSRVCEPVKAFHEKQLTRMPSFSFVIVVTCPPWIIMSSKVATNHFYGNRNIYCDCMPFFWQMSSS